MRALTLLSSVLMMTGFLGSQAFAGKAHVHGAAKLAVALVKDKVEMEFTAPAQDIFGFESPKKARKNAKAVAKVIDQLKTAMGLFEWQSSSQCALSQYDIEAFGKSYNKLKQQPKHKHHHNHHQEHSELIAKYQFACSGSIKEDGFTSAIIREFPSIKKMDIVVISDHRQFGLKGKKALVPISFDQK